MKINRKLLKHSKVKVLKAARRESLNLSSTSRSRYVKAIEKELRNHRKSPLLKVDSNKPTNLPYKKSVAELEAASRRFWPQAIQEKALQIDPTPILLETLDQFVSVLTVGTTNLEQLFTVLDSIDLPANVFLKHLVVLTDFSAEKIQDMNIDFDNLFPQGRLDYVWNGINYSYKFSTLPRMQKGNVGVASKLDSKSLKLSGEQLRTSVNLNGLLKDVIAVLIHGSASANLYAARKLRNCFVGKFLNKHKELEEFMRRRYVEVSRITAGERANALGHALQQHVKAHIERRLGSSDFAVQCEKFMPETRYKYDLLISRGDTYVGIDINFQETTNSTVEQKSQKALTRYEKAEKLGYKVAYVVDGPGSFRRKKFVEALREHSHCIVTSSDLELDRLSYFLRTTLQDC